MNPACNTFFFEHVRANFRTPEIPGGLHINSRYFWWTSHGLQICLVDSTWLHMDYKSPSGVHLGACGTPDDLTNGVHMFHMNSMWTPEIRGFHSSDSRWTPDKAHVESTFTPSESVAQCKVHVHVQLLLNDHLCL